MTRLRRSRLIITISAVLLIYLLMVFREGKEISADTSLSGTISFAESGSESVFFLDGAPLLTSHGTTSAQSYRMVVLVLVCDRIELTRCLDSLLKYKSDYKIDIVVSADCGTNAATEALKNYGDRVQFVQNTDQIIYPGVSSHQVGYYKLTRHYLFALNHVFRTLVYDSAIVVEDDLEVAPDFYEYFVATRPLLDLDPTLLCVSAWNDNGKPELTQGNNVLYRTDFFPGLGWMLTRQLWDELQPKWPQAFWDDWLREPEQRKNRACIRPEIPRTYNFGKKGVSHGQFYEQYLAHNVLNSEFVAFKYMDLSYLIRDKYDMIFRKAIHGCPIGTLNDIIRLEPGQDRCLRINYHNTVEFSTQAASFGLMPDLKAGIPRMAYLGVVSFMYHGFRIHLAPPDL